MGFFDWMFNAPPEVVEPSATSAKRGRRGLTVNERRQSRQRQLQDLQERIALEEARAKVRAIKARGRAKQAATTSPIASVRETLEEAFDLADSLRGGGRRDRDYEPSVPAPDAPGWERLLNSPAGLRLAEAVAPALAPMLAGIMTTAAGVVPTANAAQAVPVPNETRHLSGPEPVPNEAEENVATNLIASVVQFAHLPPEQAASALIQTARTEAVNGRAELLTLVTNAAKTPAILIRAVASRYTSDPNYGAEVTHLLTTPGYLDTLLRTMRLVLDAPTHHNSGAF